VPQVRLADIAKRYGRDTYAVRHLDLEIPDGSFTAILGPSGCGKTTTLRMLAGLEQPTEGTITVGDRVLSDAAQGLFVPPNHRDLGLVFQNYALWPHLNVIENVEFGLRLRHVARPERRRRVGEVLDLLHVGHLAERLPAQLSGGEQQRVAIARALAAETTLVLFDEPLSNLDAPLRLELSSELNRLHRELGMTALLVTHDQAEAMAVATQLVVMRAGQIEQVDAPQAVYRNPASVHVARFLGSPPMNLMERGGALGGLVDAIARANHLERPVAQLGARPEHVVIDDEVDGWRFAGRIEAVLPTGPGAIVRLRLNDGTLLAAVVDAARLVAPGSDIEATIRLEHVHLFDDDGDRIAFSPGSGQPSSRSAELVGPRSGR
jgi:iron(III) transport system ATP-binding protein